MPTTPIQVSKKVERQEKKEGMSPQLRESHLGLQFICVGFLLGLIYLLVCELWPRFITPETLFNVSRAHFAVGLVVVILTSKIAAPYGKHAPSMKLPDVMMSARIGWMIQESPTLFAVMFSIFAQMKAQEKRMSIEFDYELNWLQWATVWIHPVLSLVTAPLRLFCFHYIHRTLVFPFKLHAPNPVPFTVVLMATFYCSFNGTLQAVATQLAPKKPHPLSLTDLNYGVQLPIALTGLVLFLFGMYVNVRSDYTLIGLKKKKVTGKKVPVAGALAASKDPETKEQRYSIPTGFFMFDYVSCPNFFGEMVEWLGYSLFVTGFATFDIDTKLSLYDTLVVPWLALVGLAEPNAATPTTLAAFSFFFFTCTNVATRAVSHHQWYLKTFGDSYKRLNRKAVFPFIL